MTPYTPPLRIEIAWSKAFRRGEAWARRLQRWFVGSVDHYAVPEPNIPVLLWSGTGKPKSPRTGTPDLPPDIAWKEAARTALLILVDPEMLATPAWRDWCSRQASARRAGDLILPCTVTSHFANAGEGFESINAIRLDRISTQDRQGELELLATHALARWFGDGRRGRTTRLFISHTKAPAAGLHAREMAMGLKNFIDSKPIGNRFFDEVDITGGQEFAHVLEASIADSVVVVLLTDKFSSRYWCGFEVATAKGSRRPVVVVDALHKGEPVSLAYLGKSPTIHWDIAGKGAGGPAFHRRVVATALLEQLRLSHDTARLTEIRALALPRRRHVHISTRPLELATLPDFSLRGGTPTIVLHSDPPTPRYEVALIERQRPDLMVASATQALSGCTAEALPLRGLRVAVSISDSPNIGSTGLSAHFQERLFTHLASHLISAGAEVAYGGDLRAKGYTEQLVDLARLSADAGRPLPTNVVHWYVGWPTNARLSTSDRERIPRAFRIHEVRAPAAAQATDPNWPPTDTTPAHRFAWTLATRAMRLRMAEECDARVLVGGPFLSVSPWPGLLEEFETFAALGKPIYLLGGMGGITREITALLRGGSSPALTRDFQEDGGRRRAINEYFFRNASALRLGNAPIHDWSARTAAIQKLGIRGLRNGLRVEENERLFSSRSDTEVVSLVLRGLQRVSKAHRSRAAKRSRR